MPDIERSFATGSLSACLSFRPSHDCIQLGLQLKSNMKSRTRLPRNAMHSPEYAVARCLFVCPSVCYTPVFCRNSYTYPQTRHFYLPRHEVGVASDVLMSGTVHGIFPVAYLSANFKLR